MTISLSKLEDALIFVSSDYEGTNHAYLDRETGEMFYDSENADSYDLPEDIDDPDKYISIPHRNELDLGRDLAIRFASRYLPDQVDRVDGLFHRQGAYSRFKDLVERKGFLEKWYEFEKDQQDQALREWCEENDIELKEK